MEAPAQIQPTKLANYLEVLSKAAFQAGISWKVVEVKWPGIREGFAAFDPNEIAGFTPEDLDRLTSDTRMIRNRRKIEATVENAKRMLALEQEHGSFRAYLRSHAGFDALVKDLKRRFKFIGDMGAY